MLRDSNYINLKSEELDKPIYRIMPVQRLLQCLDTNKLVLVPPRKWDDPFENLLLSAQVETSSGELGNMAPMRDSIYGQCWTLHRETDAMWRIYSHDKSGAKIRTTPRKLLSALASSKQPMSYHTCFIGKVEYKTQKDLIDSLKAIDLLESSGAGLAQSLLYKRREFSHEKEIRLIYSEGSKDICPFNINPNELFEEIVFDPRMDRLMYEAYKKAVTGSGFVNRVAQSVLYRPPEGLRIGID
ncbi:MAG TPA: DUF2971 domain-containing protein [Anaerolineales bacterium]|nr:DUF2971 domain-containing protein [Anaerolineales bacterium]